MQPPGLVVGIYVFITVGLTVIVGLLARLIDVGLERDLASPAVALATATTLVVAICATWLTWLGTREPIGVADARVLRRLVVGAALGALVVTVAVLVPVLVGATTLTLVTPVPVGAGLRQFLALAPAGVGEELLIRGLGFNALRRGVGDKFAVVLSSLAFGALHIWNPNSSWLAVLMVALVGVWFGTMTVKTGSIWLAVGAHLSWNFFEGFIYGQTVSGNAPKASLFVASTETTSRFWSGADFGPEAAGFTAVVLVVAVVVTLLSKRRVAT